MGFNQLYFDHSRTCHLLSAKRISNAYYQNNKLIILGDASTSSSWKLAASWENASCLGLSNNSRPENGLGLPPFVQ